MRLLIDENMSSRRLTERLRQAGHDVVIAGEVGLLTVSDARVLTKAVAENRPVLTRDHGDFADLHDLVMAVAGHHAGIPVVRFDNDPRQNLSERGIVTAIGNLVESGQDLRDTIQVLNHWR